MENEGTIEQPKKNDAISLETGLAQYEGDNTIYTDILVNFAKNNKDTLERLKDAIRESDSTLAYRTAHSLRGAAGSIGAIRLASAALALEKAFAPENRVFFDFSMEQQLNEQILLLEQEFSAVFAELNAFVAEKETPAYHPHRMDRNRTMEMLDILSPFLETGDTKCLDYLGDAKEVFLPAAEGFKLLISHLESYDFEQAYELTKHIRQFMKP